jgi:N-acetylneuraminic acid mutarotase
MREKYKNSFKSWQDWKIWTVVIAIIIATAGLIVYQRYYHFFNSTEGVSEESNENTQSSMVKSKLGWQKSPSVWGGKYSQASVVFQDKIWVIGGDDSEDNTTNDVWSSADGTSWTKITSKNLWPARTSHQAVVFDNKIWIMGGISPAGEELNDVWSSADGVTWARVTDSATWPVRANFGSIVFDNKIFIMGGWSATSPQGGEFTHYNDVWSSADGENWEQLTAEAAWAKRAYFSAYIFDNKIFIAGGLASVPQREYSDIYSSSDGKTWAKVGDLPEVRGAGAVVDTAGSFYFIGGYDHDQAIGYSLYSKDGITWSQADNVGDGPVRCFHAAVYFKDRLWLIGGTDFTDDQANDLWSTEIIGDK